MKKILCSFLLSLPLLFGCNQEQTHNDSICLNDFESISDLYKFKTVRTDTSSHLFYSLNEDSKYVTSGSSSLKLTIDQGSIQELMFPFSYNGVDIFDKSILNSVSIDIFNASTKDVPLNVNIYNSSSLDNLLTKTVILTNSSWNKIDFSLSSIAIKSNYESIKGVVFRFTSDGSGTFYVDNLRVKLGLASNEDDQKYEEKINSLQYKISLLPSEIKYEDYETLETLYEEYASLPDLYRRVVNNYSKLLSSIQSLAKIINEKNEGDLVKEMLGFDSFIGVGELYNHKTVGGDLEFLYQHSVAYEDEKGSLKASFFGTVWNYLGYTLPNDVLEYDYTVFHLFNEDKENNQIKRVYFGWNGNYVDCEPNVWTSVKVNTETLVNSSYGIIVNQLKNGLSTTSSGALYFGQVMGYKSEFKDIGNALVEDNPLSLSGVNCTQNGLDVVPNETGVLDIRFNKKIKNLSSVEEASFSIYSEFGVDSSLIGFDGNVIKTQKLNKGWNLIQLDYLSFNDLVSLRLEVRKGEKLFLTKLICYKNSSFELAYTYLSMFGLPKENDLLTSDVPSLVSFYEAYSKISKDQIETLGNLYENAEVIINSLLNSIKSKSIVNDYVRSIIDGVSDDELSPLLISLQNSYLIKECANESIISLISNKNKYYGISYGEGDTISKGLDYNWEGTVKEDFDPDMGKIYSINVSKMLFPSFLQFENSSFDISNYAKVVTYVYNPLNKNVSGNFFNVNPSNGNWEVLSSFALLPNSWNKLEIEASKITGSRSFLMLMGDLVSPSWKMTPYYGINYSKYTSSIISRIDELPLDIKDEKDSIKVLSLMEAYRKLDEQAKNRVTNFAKLNELYSTIKEMELAYEANTSSYSLDSESSDFAYGSTLEAEVGSGNTFFVGVLKNDVLKKLSSYKSAFFYVYVSSSSGTSSLIFQYDKSWRGPSFALKEGYNRISLSKNEWFNNEENSGDMYLYFSSSSTSIWKITSIYGIKEAA
ncbi:MAG: hypothetical protein SO132_03685 [Candidatus Enteromonas sp.]|nr:hypothetical protein [Candidatus Enteromonas sp.]